MPVFKIEICAASFEELREKIANLAVSMGFGGFSEKPEPETKKAKPAKKEKAVAPEPETPPALEPPSLETATSLLKKVNDTKGLPAAREVLTAVGCNRMSEVPHEKYADVIAACVRILA